MVCGVAVAVAAVMLLVGLVGLFGGHPSAMTRLSINAWVWAPKAAMAVVLIVAAAAILVGSGPLGRASATMLALGSATGTALLASSYVNGVTLITTNSTSVTVPIRWPWVDRAVLASLVVAVIAGLWALVGDRCINWSVNAAAISWAVPLAAVGVAIVVCAHADPFRWYPSFYRVGQPGLTGGAAWLSGIVTVVGPPAAVCLRPTGTARWLAIGTIWAELIVCASIVLAVRLVHVDQRNPNAMFLTEIGLIIAQAILVLAWLAVSRGADETTLDQ